MSKESILDIAVVSKLSGYSVSTLRYYEEVGLIQPHGRKGLRREYKEKVVENLAIISLAQQANFSLQEIKQLFTKNNTPKINRNQLLKKAQEIEGQIQQLQTIKRGLEHAANCPEENQLNCKKFNRILDMAQKHRVKQRKK